MEPYELLIGNRWTGDETLLFPVHSPWASRQPDTRGSLSFDKHKISAFEANKTSYSSYSIRSFPRNKLDEIIKVESRATGDSRENDNSQFHVPRNGEILSGSLNNIWTSSGWRIFLLRHYTRCRISCFVEKFVLTWRRKLWCAKGFRGVKCSSRDFVEEWLFFT